MIAQRDIFFDTLFEYAKEDKDVYLIAADCGAKSLDRWRDELPDQFIYTGISEQHTINFAAGLASEGKKVYVYFMACWVARCFEQIRYSCAMAKNNITIVGTSVGLGYHPAGPAHEPTEDLAYMRSLCGLEIHSPSNNNMTKSLVDLTYQEPKLRYVRLERTQPQGFENLYNYTDNHFIEGGIFSVRETANNSNDDLAKHLSNRNKSVMILSSGYMLEKANNLYKMMSNTGYSVALVDAWKLPINYDNLKSISENYDTLVTIEEQSLNGGFGSAICEAVCDMDLNKKVVRLGLPNKYIFDNGSRNHILETNGFDTSDMYESVIGRLK